MGNGSDSEIECSSALCSYGVYKRIAVGCSPGNGSCREAIMLVAKVSEFHTEALRWATAEIKAILEEAHRRDAERINGRKLSFLHTNMGCLLAWVEHGAIVTSDDADETIADALGLEGWDTGKSAQQTS